MHPTSRRRFLAAVASGGVALTGAGVFASSAAAATDDELAFANFGASTELLLQDFYAKARASKLFGPSLQSSFARSQFAAREHVAALAAALTDSGQTPPLAEDFEFAWPNGTFASRKAIGAAGLVIVESLIGAYLTGAAASPTASFRALYSSLAASLGEQHSVLMRARGRAAIGNSFPAALPLEDASSAVERFLG